MTVAQDPAAAPAWTPPAYADPAGFTEQELDLTADSVTVGGTLTLPADGAEPATGSCC